MPIDKLALILTIIAVVIWAGVMLVGLVASGPVGWLALLVLAPVVYVIGTVISQRLNNREDDHYDTIER